MRSLLRGTPTCLHDLDEGQDLVHVFTRGHQTLQHQDLEVLKHVAAKTSHDLESTNNQNMCH